MKIEIVTPQFERPSDDPAPASPPVSEEDTERIRLVQRAPIDKLQQGALLALSNTTCFPIPSGLHLFLVEEAETEDNPLLQTLVVAESEEDAVGLTAEMYGEPVAEFCAPPARVSVARKDDGEAVTLPEERSCDGADCDGDCDEKVDVTRTAAEWVAEQGRRVIASTDF